MIKVENVDVWGFEHAIRGMRNPMNSWDKSDSGWKDTADYDEMVNMEFIVGENDLELMQKLLKAGTEHRKYLRQIFISMDVIAPLYWWKEFDTYKVGTVANSCSTMHTIHKKEFEYEDFSHEHLETAGRWLLGETIKLLNKWREVYIKGNSVYPKNDKKIWWQMIQTLPSSYNQRRTVTMNYENVFNILKQRCGHKLDEWIKFCDELFKLPYVEKIMEALENE